MKKTNTTVTSKEELLAFIFAEFTDEEISNINPKIYLNPEHLDYYMDFHLGEYQKCLDYLLENKALLK